MKRNALWVKAGDGWVQTNQVNIFDIESDWMGRDVYTFNYLGNQYSSLAVYGSKPG